MTEVFGHQRPRLLTVPGESLTSAGEEAVQLAARAGLQLDPWQRFVLDQSMRERADGNWAAGEVAVNLPRQNGKGALIEARELWGLFVGGEQLIMHSAHEFKTAKRAFRRIERLIRRCPDLHKRVKRFWQTTGEESVELHSGQELRFIARSGGSGRGFTADTVILDECMILGDDAMGALAPTLAAVENSQLWYLGSAGIGVQSQQLARLRQRVLDALESGKPDPALAYFEWSIDPHVDECTTGCTQHDDLEAIESILRANPAIGYRLTVEKSVNERLMMGNALYARERLGVGDYPAVASKTWQVIAEAVWRALADGDSAAEDPVSFAIDVTPERSHASICVAGAYGKGTHVEVIENRPGTGWVIERAKNLTKKHNTRCWVVDPGSPAGSLIGPLRAALADLDGEGPEVTDDGVPIPAVPIVETKTRDVVQATGQFYDAVVAGEITHLDNAPLATALAGARKRELGDAWAWARRAVGVDISPLVGVTLAKWGLQAEIEEPEEEVEPWAEYA